MPLLMRKPVDDQVTLGSDILILDYQAGSISIYKSDQIDYICKLFHIDLKSLLSCINDHKNRLNENDVFVFNGYTFIRSCDFSEKPIQANIGQHNPSVISSVRLLR